jgi:hypothetical protein
LDNALDPAARRLMMRAIGQWYRRKVRTSVVLLLVLIAAGAVGARGEEAAEVSPLLDVLRFVPTSPSSATVFFTDWGVLKDYVGFDAAFQDRLAEAETALTTSLGQGQAAASAFGANRPDQAALWGWRSSDLQWEANFTSSKAVPIYVLKFSADFQFGPLVSLFEQRGFMQTESHGLAVYSHPLDFGATWMAKSELAILNTAVVAEGGLLFLSSSAAALDEALSAYRAEIPTLSEDATAQRLASRLRGVASAILVIGPGACSSLFTDPVLESFISASDPKDLRAALDALLAQRTGLHVFTAFGVAYRYDGEQPVGTFVFGFRDPSSANSDLPLRRGLAESGVSVQGGHPYSQVAFTMITASVEGADLTLTVRPVDDQPRRLFQLVLARDVLFALCP